MAANRFPSIHEQVAQHLRDELMRGTWTKTMPGRNQLSAELGVSGRTIELAFQQLEKDGFLEQQGVGRRRRILTQATEKTSATLRIALLLPSRLDRSDDFIIDARYLIEEAGHIPFFPDKSMADFNMDVGKIAKYVDSIRADIWVVAAGSRELLEWFASRSQPVFALFGRRRGVPLASAGPDKTDAIIASTQRLLDFGHRRITLLCRKARRLPEPGKAERVFLNELTNAGITVSKFNLPDWEENKEGFTKLLESLFGPTPPTALIVDEPFLFNAVYYFVSKRGLRVPEDISLICTDNHPAFAWCDPSVAHISWNYRPVIRRLARWVKNIQQGREDRRETHTKATFVEGGSIGPKRPSE